MNAAKQYSKSITPRQIAKIYAIGNNLGLVDSTAEQDMLHELVESMTGKVSIKDLTVNEAIEVIDRLEPKKPERKQFVQRQGMATEGQIKKIFRLLYELKEYDGPGEHAPLKKRLRGFLKKYASTDDMEFLTYRKANSVIEGLKGAVQSAENKAGKAGDGHEIQGT